MENFMMYGLPFLALIITVSAQAYVNSSYSKYKKIANSGGITGAEAARQMLDKNGLQNVRIRISHGVLSDHYDPRNKTVNLSKDIYDGRTVAGISVACHECGHALQDKDGYTFMRIRAALVPVTNFSSKAGYFAILFGLIFSSTNLLWLGIFAEVVILLFQLVTLPVEFNASNRALKEIESLQLLNGSQQSGARTMLKAAALTYVASVASVVLELIRLIFIARLRDRD